MKIVFGVVEATPSEPPSNTLTAPSSQIDRLLSRIEPGTTALKVVFTEQIDPTVVSTVELQGTVTAKYGV
jgi:hypothetical protein